MNFVLEVIAVNGTHSTDAILSLLTPKAADRTSIVKDGKTSVASIPSGIGHGHSHTGIKEEVVSVD